MKQWYKSLASAERDAAKENCDIITSANRWTDIYYLIPRSAAPGIVRIIQRSQSDCGARRCRVIYKHTDGSLLCVAETTIYRARVVQSGSVPESKVEEYLRGYYTRREESSLKIRARKEAARISHELCDLGGSAGHKERQRIRRRLRETRKI